MKNCSVVSATDNSIKSHRSTILNQASITKLHEDFKDLISLVANKYAHGNYHLKQDLVQEGNIGFHKALSRFDPEKNDDFEGFAQVYITGHMKDFLKKEYRVKKYGSSIALSFKTDYEGDTFHDQILDEFKSSMEEERFAMQLELSLIKPLIESFMDNNLTDVQKRVCKDFYIKGHSNKEVSKRNDLSPPRVSKIVRDLEIKIRKEFQSKDETVAKATGQLWLQKYNKTEFQTAA